MSRITLAGQQCSPTQPLTGRVTQIVDGDTIDVELQGRHERVRYIGIDTSETKHPSQGVEPYGPEATEANRRLVGGQMVRLEFDVQPRDQYGRLLAYVYVGEVMVNAELMRQGYALLSTYPPNVGRRQQRYAKLHSFLEDAVVSRGYQILGSATPAQNVQEIEK
jgi:micrococcal nuclease